MAAIYRAHREDDQRRVAVKLQLPNTAHLPSMCARFDMEADAMRRVHGKPNVVGLHHAGVLDDGRRYFVMEWIEGEDLEERLDFLRNQDERLSVADICRIGRDIATGLHAMHEQGLVHRDLKPANVMLGRDDDGQEVVKLVDFGIVADLLSTTPATSEAEEAILGTSAYMAPEQAAGASAAPGMDLFALGVVLYEALTGSCIPPDGWTPETLPSIESSRRGVPPELAELVRACMSGEVRRRPRSAGEAALRLAGLFEQSSEAGSSAYGSDARPARTGRTVVTPALGLAELPPARTGETEVSLTQEEVDAIVGTIAPPAAAPVHEPGPPACVPVEEWLANEGRIAVIPDPVEAEDRGPRGSRMRVSPVAPSVEDVREEATIPPLTTASPEGSDTTESQPVPSENEHESTEEETAIRCPPADGVAALAPDDQPTTTPVVFATRIPSDDYRADPTIAEEHPIDTPVSKQEDDLEAAPPLGSSESPGAPRPDTALCRTRASSKPNPAAGASVHSGNDSPPDLSADHFPVLPHVTSDDMLDVVPRRRHRWIVPTLAVSILLAGLWLFVGQDGSEARAKTEVDVVASDGEADSPPSPAETPSPPVAIAPSVATAEDEDNVAPPSSAPVPTPKSYKSTRSPPSPSSKACKRKRAEAASAAENRDWKAVLDATRRRICWSGRQAERTRMRVEALTESRRYQQCAKEGSKSSDRETITRVALCTKRLSKK